MGMYYNYYNPKKCALGLIYNNDTEKKEKRAGILEFAPSLNPEATGKPQKGVRYFDWDNKKRFFIYQHEAIRLQNEMKMIIEDPSIKQANQNFGKITHSPTGDFSTSTSEINFTAYTPEGKDVTYYTITYRKTENRAEASKVSYTFTDIYELKIFMDFLELVGKTAPSYFAMTEVDAWKKSDKKDEEVVDNSNSNSNDEPQESKPEPVQPKPAPQKSYQKKEEPKSESNQSASSKTKLHLF